MAVTLHERIGVIETNLDDLQSGLEAESRAIVSMQDDVHRVDEALGRGIETAHLAGSLLHKARTLRTCLNDQRDALRELRQNMARLRHELQGLIKR